MFGSSTQVTNLDGQDDCSPQDDFDIMNTNTLSNNELPSFRQLPLTDRNPIRIRTKKVSAMTAFKGADSKQTKHKLTQQLSIEIFNNNSPIEEGGMLDRDSPLQLFGLSKTPSTSSRLIKIPKRRLTNAITEGFSPLQPSGAVSGNISQTLFNCQEQEEENDLEDLLTVHPKSQPAISATTQNERTARATTTTISLPYKILPSLSQKEASQTSGLEWLLTKRTEDTDEYVQSRLEKSNTTSQLISPSQLNTWGGGGGATACLNSPEKKSRFHFEAELGSQEIGEEEEKSKSGGGDCYRAHTQSESSFPRRLTKINKVLPCISMESPADSENGSFNFHSGAQSLRSIPRNSPVGSMKKPISQRFIKATHAIITISRLSNQPAKTISSVKELESEFQQFRKEGSFRLKQQDQQVREYSPSKEAFDNLHRREKLSHLCERGAEEDINAIKKILDSDPKRYLRSPEDPTHLLNAWDGRGLSPLYVACRSGHINVVQFLIREKCLATQKSQPQKGLFETPLEVSIRWNHASIALFLLDSCTFDERYLLQCLPLLQPNQRDLKKAIQQKLATFSGSSCLIF